MSVVRTLRDAAAVVPDGALVTFGGFQLNRAPMALLRELVRQGRRGLRAVTLPNPLALDLLVGAGVVEEATFGFCGFEYEAGFVTAPNVRRAVEARAIRWVERDVYEIVQGLRAAAMGLSSLPAPGGEGSDYRGVNGTPAQVDPVSGEEVLVAEAIRPDVALLHAPVADRVGNLRIDDRYADDLLACASRRVVATAERIVDRLESPTVGAHLVEVVAEAPGGALPTSCRGHYGYGATELREYVTRAAE
ncbi:MAG: CoA transferase subunit A, partial [Acidobacteriota bacterium]